MTSQHLLKTSEQKMFKIKSFFDTLCVTPKWTCNKFAWPIIATASKSNCSFRKNFSEVALEINLRPTTPEMNALPLDQLLNKQKMLIHSICLHKRVIIVSNKMIQTLSTGILHICIRVE